MGRTGSKKNGQPSEQRSLRQISIADHFKIHKPSSERKVDKGGKRVRKDWDVVKDKRLSTTERVSSCGERSCLESRRMTRSVTRSISGMIFASLRPGNSCSRVPDTSELSEADVEELWSTENPGIDPVCAIIQPLGIRVLSSKQEGSQLRPGRRKRQGEEVIDHPTKFRIQLF